MKKKAERIMREFEAELKEGKQPHLKDYEERYGKLDEATRGTLRALQSLYVMKGEMKLPSGFSEEQRKLAEHLVQGKPGRKQLKRWEERTKDSGEPLEVPHPLTQEYGGVPVVSLAAAGTAQEYEVDALMTSAGWEKITRPFDLPYENVFAVQIRGDSLEPLVSEGCYVLVDPRKEVYSGNLAWIITRDYRASVKRVRFRGNKVILVSANPEYPPQELARSEVLKMYPVVWIKLKD